MTTRNWGFCDLSLERTFNLNKLHVIEKLGYNTVAINTFVQEPAEEPKKKKKKGEKADKEKLDPIPAPIEISADVTNNIKLNILQRVTIEFSDSSIIHNLSQSQNLRKYDIIAVVPTTLNAFQYACSTMDVDIITFAPETRLPFKVHRKMFGLAVERRIFFELMYSSAIRDATARKNIINVGHYYHSIGKSKNIIICSGAENCEQVRDVHDVINLGFILGLNNNQSLEAIRKNPQSLILKAEGRKCGKYYMIVNNVSEDNEINMSE